MNTHGSRRQSAIATILSVLLVLMGCPSEHGADGVDAEAGIELDTTDASPAQNSEITASGASTDALDHLLPRDGVPGTAVGTLPGEFEVSDDGVAGYRIPLTIPMHHATVGVDLGLRYASSSGNGILGIGFSLSGLSTIALCERTPVPDGVRAPLRLDGSDNLCLDGQRLILISGEHLADGAEYRLEEDRFSRITTAAAGASIDGFYLDEPSGRRKVYGFSPDSAQRLRGQAYSWSVSRIEDRFGNFATVHYSSAESNVVASGASPAVSTTQHRPASIRLWGHGVAAPRLAVRFDYEGRNDAEERHLAGGVRRLSHRLQAIRLFDPEGTGYGRYVFGYERAPSTDRSRLTSVTRCGEANDCLPPTHFEYTNAEVGFSLAETSDFGFANERWPSLNRSDSRLAAVNVDGDAFDDLMFVSDETDTWHVWRGGPGSQKLDTGIASPLAEEMHWYPTRFRGYVDNDAREDLVVIDEQLEGPPTSLSVISTGSDAQGIGVVEYLLGPAEEIDQPFGRDDVPVSLTTSGDFNGDGLMDLAMCVGTEESSAWRFFWNRGGSGWDREATASENCALDEYMVIDVDGDRAADLLRLEEPLTGTPAEYMVVSRSPDGLWLEEESGLSRGVYQRLLLEKDGRMFNHRSEDIVVDLNGDQLPDIVRAEPSLGEIEGPGDPEFQEKLFEPLAVAATYLNTGDGFRPGPRLGTGPEEIWPENLRNAAVADVNLDGGSDLIVFMLGPDEEPHYFALGLEPDADQATGAYDTWAEPLWDLDDVTNLIGPFDFNSDGLADFIAQTGATEPGNGRLTPAVRVGGRADLLVEITDGLGARTTIDYASLRLIHETRLDCPDDNDGTIQCANDARPVVQFDTRDSGADSVAGAPVRVTTEHAYKDGRSHRLGRGWLGFAEHSFSVVDASAPDALTRVVFDNRTYDEDVQGFPFAKRAYRTTHESEVVDGKRLVVDRRVDFVVRDGVESRTSYVVPEHERQREFEIPTPPGSCSPHQDCAVDLATLEGMTAVRDVETSREFDSFGNVTRMRVDRAGGSTSIIDREYLNDADRWILGKTETRTERSIAGIIEAQRTSTFSYDPETGGLVGSVVEPDDPLQEVKVTYLLDGFGNSAASEWSPAVGEPRLVAVEYDTLGVFPRTVTPAIPNAEQRVYSYRHGGLRRSIDANGVVIDRTFDGFGRPIQLEERNGVGGAWSGVATSTAYERVSPGPWDEPSTMRVTDSTPGHAWGSVRFDRLARPIEESEKLPTGEVSLQRRTYDGGGMLTSVELPHLAGDAATGATEWTYDALRRVRTEESADGSRVITTYPTAFETKVQDPLGRSFRSVVDGDGRVVWTQDNLGTATCMDYGPFSHLVRLRRKCSETPAHWVTSQFDAYGRRLASYDPNQGGRSFQYDSYGLLTRMTDAGGSVTMYVYDALGRQVERHDGSGTTRWVWDGGGPFNFVGALQSDESPDGITNSYAYDAFGRLTSHVRVGAGPDPLTTRFEYDAQGRLFRTKLPASFGQAMWVDREYSAWGHLTSVINATDNLLLWARLGTHPAGMVDREGFGNGLVTTRTFDELTLRPSGIETADEEGETPVQSLSFEFYDDGNLESRTDEFGGQSGHCQHSCSVAGLDHLTFAGSGVCGLSFTTSGRSQRRVLPSQRSRRRILAAA